MDCAAVGNTVKFVRGVFRFTLLIALYASARNSKFTRSYTGNLFKQRHVGDGVHRPKQRIPLLVAVRIARRSVEARRSECCRVQVLLDLRRACRGMRVRIAHHIWSIVVVAVAVGVHTGGHRERRARLKNRDVAEIPTSQRFAGLELPARAPVVHGTRRRTRTGFAGQRRKSRSSWRYLPGRPSVWCSSATCSKHNLR